MTKYFFVLIATITSSILFSSCKKEKSVLAEAKFTFSGDLVVIPSQIQFTNNSFGISYIWDFGDGTSSNDKNPIHTYNEYGLYKVKLTAKGSNNIDTIVKDLLIGGNLGQIGGLNCAGFISNTNFKIGETYSDEIVQIPYTSGNGGVYNSFSVNSTGVLGLNAKLNRGKFNNGNGTLELLISGTASSIGNAKFKIYLVGKSCELNLFVTDTTGLIGWWPFNGNANDESGNGNNGTVNGANLTTDRNGVANQAYSFEPNSNSNINIPFSSTLNTIQNGITISAWIYMDGGTSAGAPPRILELRGAAGFVMLSTDNNNSSRAFVLGWNSGNINLGFSPTNRSLTTLNWHLISFTANGTIGEAKYYFDGVLQSTSYNNTITQCNYDNSPLILGAEPNLQGKWGGKLDDIGIWNRALTQQEITDLYYSK
jgi:PKD repeat protein